MTVTNPPVVLCFSGADPTGGAGIQADIETLSSHGCIAASVITAATVQDTIDVISFSPMPSDLIIEQARAVLEDMPIAAIKTRHARQRRNRHGDSFHHHRLPRPSGYF